MNARPLPPWLTHSTEMFQRWRGMPVQSHDVDTRADTHSVFQALGSTLTICARIADRSHVLTTAVNPTHSKKSRHHEDWGRKSR